MKKTILIATRRKGKLDEFQGILPKEKFTLLTLEDINFPKVEPNETGKSFEENAEIKARFYGEKSGLLTLADDSGLEVYLLPNVLGIKTRRYTKGSDQDRNNKLLAQMKNLKGKDRKAVFVSAVAFYNPKTKKVMVKTGRCEGMISTISKGKNGFGYDPIFVVKKLNKHFAELTLSQKNKVSHRANALRKILKYL